MLRLSSGARIPPQTGGSGSGTAANDAVVHTLVNGGSIAADHHGIPRGLAEKDVGYGRVEPRRVVADEEIAQVRRGRIDIRLHVKGKRSAPVDAICGDQGM
jgi:hypothetical protein